MEREPIFKSKEEEAILTFICENESQWDKNHWDDLRKLSACCEFGIEYGKSTIREMKGIRK